MTNCEPIPSFNVVDLRGSNRELRRSHAGRERLAQRLAAKGYPMSPDMARRMVEERPFIFWDGEGYDSDRVPADPAWHPPELWHGQHFYMLFGNSLDMEVSGESLATAQCLDLIYDTERQYPNCFHTIFAGKYDVNMMLKDLHFMTLQRLHDTGRARWGGYKIEYAPGKYFRIGRDNITATVYDVWAFFASSFVRACQEYLGESEALDFIESMKKERGKFSYADLPEVRRYMREELRYGVRLMNKLRANLLAADINISHWHGPGAVASKMMSIYGVKQHMQPTPPEVLHVLQHAYAGGRPEQLKGGVHLGPVWVHDVNSMYPAAMATLPSLRNSEWEYVDGPISPTDVQDYGIYRVSARTPFNARFDLNPYPLFWRGRHGEVYYPKDIEGWYWGVEVKLLAEYRCYDTYEIREAWILHPATDDKPFGYLSRMYEQRRAWKDGTPYNPAEIALRLGMNSKYGKTAQRVGAHRGGPPKWHQLEWAGLTTAIGRAMLYRAMRKAEPGSLVACATDSVFVTAPVDLPVSKRLGDWDEERYDGIIMLQSGVYWLLRDGVWKAKYRGFDKGSLTEDMALDYLRRLDNDPNTAPLVAESTRFMTWSQTRGNHRWRNWYRTPRELTFGSPLSKRGHYVKACPQCVAGASLTDTLHGFYTSGLPWIGRTISTAHSLPWSDYGTDSEYPDFEEVAE